MIKVILVGIIFIGLVLAGLIGPLSFVLIMALVVILLIPGVILTTGAGLTFGIIEGSLAVVFGTTLGASVAFLLARYGFGDRAAGIVRRHARLVAGGIPSFPYDIL